MELKAGVISGVYTILKRNSSKVNVIIPVDSTLAYDDVPIQHVNHRKKNKKDTSKEQEKKKDL